MKFVISADPFGYPLKETVKAHLKGKGHEMVDVGTTDPDVPILFVDAAGTAARMVQTGEADYGFLFCGSGMGMSIVANKHKGVYCAVVESLFTAHLCREINNANMMSLGNNVVGPGLACAMVDEFLATEFGNGAGPERMERLKSYIDQVKALEDENYK